METPRIPYPKGVSDLLGWIETNIPEDKWKESGDTLLKAAIYAMAVHEAEMALEDMTVKDYAEALIGGSEPYDEDDLAEWVQDWAEADDDDQEIPRQLADYLKKFWGVK